MIKARARGMDLVIGCFSVYEQEETEETERDKYNSSFSVISVSSCSKLLL
jgi:hypothetical protein